MYIITLDRLVHSCREIGRDKYKYSAGLGDRDPALSAGQVYVAGSEMAVRAMMGRARPPEAHDGGSQ